MSWSIQANGHKTVSAEAQAEHDEKVKAAFREVRRVLEEAEIADSAVYISTSPPDFYPPAANEVTS